MTLSSPEQVVRGSIDLTGHFSCRGKWPIRSKQHIPGDLLHHQTSLLPSSDIRLWLSAKLESTMVSSGLGTMLVFLGGLPLGSTADRRGCATKNNVGYMHPCGKLRSRSMAAPRSSALPGHVLLRKVE